MLRNYLKIAGRNLNKHLAFSVINILGLALGMSCCLFIFLWVEDEKSVDNFHSNGPDLYTAYETRSANQVLTGSYRTPVRQRQRPASDEFLMENLPRSVPEVQSVVFYATGYELPWGHPETIQAGPRKEKLKGARASRDFFKMFSYPLVEGSIQTALPDIGSIAISRKMAVMFFGSPKQAMGKSLRYENKLDLMVSSVFEDIGSESSLHFDFLLNWDAQKSKLEWASAQFRTYVQILPGADAAQVAARINRVVSAGMPDDPHIKTQVGLQPVKDQYLYATFVDGKPTAGRIEYVRIFTGVAAFILLIACINFMVLSTARSVKRAKEVGVRKVLGSGRIDLLIQFYAEALLLAFLALAITLGVVAITLPLFNTFTGKHLTFPFGQAQFWQAVIGLTVVTGLIAGSYPAFFLSSFLPVRTLKGVLQFTPRAAWFRKGLTVFQFGLAVLLLIATVVVSRQTSFVRGRHLGYDRENLLYIRIEGELAKQTKYNLFKELAYGRTGIGLVDRSSETPHTMGFVVDEHVGVANTLDGADAINWEGKEKNMSVAFKPASVGLDFVKLMNLRLAAGRDFSRANSTDSSDAFLVNEEAVRQMGMKEPLGKWISAWQKKGHIIGILKDYHTHSLHEPIKPLIVDVKEYEYFGVILVRLEAGKTREGLASLKEIYGKVNPDYPFDYHFIDQEYDDLYRSEEVMGKLSSAFTIIAIFISCLGLLGLVIFSAEQRFREIGIRKVLGASVSSIVGLLTQDFMRLIGIAVVIASPLAWYLMDRWLQGFAYKIDLEWWHFALAGAVTVGIALVTISYQSVKAALTNPVKSLRSE